MGLGNLGFGELIVIFLVVLLLFGARRIPEIAGSMGKGIREFKKSMSDVQESISGSGHDDRKERLRASDPQAVPADEDHEPHPEPKRLIG